MKTKKTAKNAAYIGAGAGFVLFAIFGLLPGSFLGGVIGLNIAGKIFGAPLGAALLPRLIVGTSMVLGILTAGLIFVLGVLGSSLRGRLAGYSIGAIKDHKTPAIEAEIKARKEMIKMGTKIGATLGGIAFLFFGIIPGFDFGGYGTLVVLNHLVGGPLEPTVLVRLIVAIGILLGIVCIASVSILVGAIMGTAIGYLVSCHPIIKNKEKRKEVNKMHTYNEGLKTRNGIMTLLLGSILGLLYVVSMPFIAIATIVTILSGILGRNIIFLGLGWRPSEAYLSGNKKRKTDDGK